jgi:hypothetical protein
MRSHLKLGACFVIISIALMPAFAQAFSQATHLYIADQVFQGSDFKNDLYYGSIGPDIQFAVRHPEKWPTAFEDTHYNFVDLRSFATSPEQAAFADGWYTHNEKDFWGADHYAHIDPAYVINKAKELTSLPLDFAHLAIEVAVDVLLKDNDDPQLGEKLLDALQHHSSQDRTLLIAVFVSAEKKTDRLTLILAELSFRQMMVQYARALSLPDPENKEALARWGAMLARRLYHMTISSDVLLKDLNDAIDLVKDDYKETVDTVIKGIQNNLK